MPQTSIREVAKRAGVSVGTVSNVLNRPNLVAEETRARVRAAIDELGFVRNESARRLRQGPPPGRRAFGVVVEDVANPFFTDVARGAERAMNAAGVDAIWCTSDGSAAKERRCLELLEEQGVDGLLIMPVGLGAERVGHLRARHTAVVLLDRDGVATDACSARVDHLAGGDVAATHLLTLGHEHIAFVTGAPNSQPSQDRRDGAARALTRAGGAAVNWSPVRDVEPGGSQGDGALANCRDADGALARGVLQGGALVEGFLVGADGPLGASRVMATVVVQAMTPTAGRQAARRLLKLRPVPTGVFCANDLLAIGVVNELLRLGVRVPEEVAVIGYDDIELAAVAAVPLTTIRQPRQELGRVAAELALAELDEDVLDGDTPDARAHAHRHIVLAPELVVRDSA